MSIEVDVAFPPERRTGRDRRRPEWLGEGRYLLGGRRRSVRRSQAGRIVRLDWYPAPLLGAVVLILALSTLDAGLTLNLLAHGAATEVNPLMAAVLDAGVHHFGNLKMALTAGGVVFVVVYSEAQLLGRVRARHGLYAIAAAYLLLVGYELALLMRT